MTPTKIVRDLLEPLGRLPRSAARGVAGSGLGPYICSLIVEAHAGRIWREPSNGRGATVAFSIPRRRQA